MTRYSSPPEALFWAHVDVDGLFSELMGNKCWVWTASTNGKAGYGRFEVSSDWGGWRMLAHRFSYQNRYGPIPAGLTIDHVCRRFDGQLPNAASVTRQLYLCRRCTGELRGMLTALAGEVLQASAILKENRWLEEEDR